MMLWGGEGDVDGDERGGAAGTEAGVVMEDTSLVNSCAHPAVHRHS